MGVMRFIIHPPSRAVEHAEVHRAYFSTLEMGIAATNVEVSGGIATCRKGSDESARLHVAWEVPGFGRPMLTTASLIEREEPYFLALELVRGKLVQVRNQLAAWETEGLKPSEEFREEFQRAHRHFSRASSQQDDVEACASEAERALQEVCGAAERLARERTEYDVLKQQRKYQHLHTLLGTAINTRGLSGSDESTFLETFNALAIPMDWRSIEPEQGELIWETVDRQLAWCELHRLIPKGGPLLNLGPNGFPDWLWAWEKDARNVQSFIADFVETAVERYAGRIRLWEIAARGNSGGALALPEERRLEIVARMLDLAHHRDPESQLFLRIDQPWGEYQARGQHRLSPFQYADALLRAGLGLSGINLEVAVGYEPRGSGVRDPLEWFRMIEAWGALRVPLFVTLAFPTSAESDSNSTSDLEVAAPNWKGAWSPDLQTRWIETYLPPLLASPIVSGVFWDHFSDVGPHLFPHGGLLDGVGKAKPAVEAIRQLGGEYL